MEAAQRFAAVGEQETGEIVDEIDVRKTERVMSVEERDNL